MSVQLENGYIRIANELWDEIIRRDFTKRQKDILLFIWRLSYGCSKKTAIIPKLKNFSLCGVGHTNITSELKYLETMKVISWDKENTIFSFNKDYNVWQVTPVRGWDDETFNELIHLNITTKSYQNNNLSKQEVIESITEKLLKQELLEPAKPSGSKDEGLSKDSIKDISTTTETIDQIHMQVFGTIIIPPLMQGFIVKAKSKGYTDSFIKEVMLEAGESANNKPSLRYLESIYDRWDKEKIYTRVESQRRKNKPKNDHGELDAQREKQKAESRPLEVITYEPAEELRSVVNG